ncbi:MAG: exopolysaccharide biosynthesis polyprenyl glycosylphosphotransferase, partial [Bacteroidota bacterium]
KKFSRPEKLKDWKAFENYCLDQQVDEIYFGQAGNDTLLLSKLSAFADQNFIYLRIASDQPHPLPSPTAYNAYYFDDIPVMSIRKEPLSKSLNQVAKRGFDMAFSLFALSFLLPFVFPFIALAIRLESRGPIFFVQHRPGRKNRLFRCLKFRSMTVNQDTEKQATKNDRRITRVGAFLRRTSLDELPQFINVLLGDMSVVGPRPNMIKQLEYYSAHIEHYSFRHFVRPGITGLAQVRGFRGETQSLELMEKRVELDIRYMETWSLALDIKLIFLTAWNMLKGEENAY